jgi:rhamnogalacturonan endolyase
MLVTVRLHQSCIEQNPRMTNQLADGAASDLNWTSAAIVDSDTDYINVKFTAKEGDFHWVIYDDLPGAYQYFVNHDLPTLGEFRTLWRLDNTSFPRGHTNVKDGVLPALEEYRQATNVQDETWQKADGSFLTKYDWSGFVRDQTYYGVYGDEVGSWYLNPGKDYYNGDHLKQELMVCSIQSLRWYVICTNFYPRFIANLRLVTQSS